MTSPSRTLLATIAGKLDQNELTAAVFLCRDRIPDGGQLDNVKTAFDLMTVLERQKVIDVANNDWHHLVEILNSKPVRRKDLAKLVSEHAKKEKTRRKEDQKERDKELMKEGLMSFMKDVIPGHSPNAPSTESQKPSPGRGGVVVKHPDWNFFTRLAEGESAIIYQGEKVRKTESLSATSKDVIPLSPQQVVGKVYRGNGRIGNEAQFLRQADVLNDVGCHDCVVRLLDVLRGDVALPCLVLELAPRSDLQSYLGTDTGRQTTLPQLDKWVSQVTDGMSFIESKGYIHANLRASSVLLFADDNVKISGFSVSRRSNDLNACRVRDDEQLAWKWLAPEVTREHVLRPQSDVWSFGIFVVELLQYGAEPYPEMSQPEELQAKLETGYRHPKPDNCPEYLYNDILVNCWQTRDERPSFDRLKVVIKEALFEPIRRKHSNDTYPRGNKSAGIVAVGNEVEMTDNELYLSPGMVTTLRRSVDNQYINCADMETVWNDFGEWEVAPEAFVLQDIIGHGHYGIVWRGQLKTGEQIAVKMCFSESPKQSDSFQKEVGVLTKLRHPHILRLHGVCARRSSGEMFIVTELMANGDLRRFLINDAGETVHLADLISFAVQISDAMEYLENQKAIHRDIAARNVLVADDRKTVKLGDFGLSRILTSDYYRLCGDTDIALLWAAPEVVEQRKYTIKSDVWSFGVLLVEMFLYGERPYAGTIHQMMDSRAVYRAIRGGYRHPKPDKCPDRVYEELMLSCWKEDPCARPSFAELHSTLSQFDTDDSRRCTHL